MIDFDNIRMFCQSKHRCCLTAVLFMLTVAVGLFCTPYVHAHPLGNYSINQYILVNMCDESPGIFYLLDMAEIPSFTELDLLDTDFDSDITRQEVEAYLDAKVPSLAENITFSIGGEAVPLKVTERKLSLLEGMGGMVVFNVLMGLRPEDPITFKKGNSLDLEIVSGNYEKGQGIRECKVVTDGHFTDATASLGKDILKYQTRVFLDDDGNSVFQDFDCQFLIRLDPVSQKASAGEKRPLAFEWTATARMAREAGETTILDGMSRIVGDIDSEDMVVEGSMRDAVEERGQPEPVIKVNTGAVDVTVPERVNKYGVPTKDNTGVVGRLFSRMSEIIRTKDIPPSLFVTGLMIAVVLGVGHAFSPGHGKSIMAAYLIGEKGTDRHAVMLGLIVTIAHTWSVLLLGAVAMFASETFSEEQISFWTGIASGGIIVVIGGMMFNHRYKTFVLTKHGIGADHHHDHHHHALDHAKDPAKSLGNIFWLGISGGMMPCPSALIVLLLALKFGRPAYGMWLIVAFSAGLGLVLVAIGLVVVRVSKEVRKHINEQNTILLFLPVVSSALITLLGIWVVVWTLLQYNVLVFMPGR